MKKLLLTAVALLAMVTEAYAAFPEPDVWYQIENCLYPQNAGDSYDIRDHAYIGYYPEGGAVQWYVTPANASSNTAARSLGTSPYLAPSDAYQTHENATDAQINGQLWKFVYDAAHDGYKMVNKAYPNGAVLNATGTNASRWSYLQNLDDIAANQSVCYFKLGVVSNASTGEPQSRLEIVDYSTIVCGKYMDIAAGPQKYQFMRTGNENNGTLWRFYTPLNVTVSVTITYTYNGQPVGTSITSGIVGSTYAIPTPAFFTDVIPDGTFKAGETAVTVELKSLHLPFAWTETTDNMIWQVVQIHSTITNEHPTWQYSEDDSNDMLSRINDAARTNGYTDNQLWAFVGNMNTGFKIYNKAAGTDKWLYADGTTNSSHIKVGTTTERSMFHPYPSRTSTDATTYCCFKAEGTPYINYNSALDNGAVRNYINFWGDNDNGSTCWFTAASEPWTDAAETILNLPAGTVGTANSLEDLRGAYDACTDDRFDLGKTTSLKEELTKLNDLTDVLAFDETKWYRLSNVSYGNFLVSGTNDKIYGNETSHMTNHHSIIKFVPVEGQEDSYHLLSQGLYFGNATVGSNGYGVNVLQVDENGDRGEYSLVKKGYAKYALADQTIDHDKNCLHQGGDNVVVGWGHSAAQSQWYVQVAEELHVNLGHKLGEANVSFGYFPFPVKAADGSKLYYLATGTDKDDATVPVVTYIETPSVLADRAFMIVNENETRATLAIDYDSLKARAANPQTVAEGFYRASNVEAGDYTVNQNGDGLEFVKATAPANVAGNFVYIPSANLSTTENAANSLPVYELSDTTLGISEVNAEGGNKAIYDLQGRRVVAPVKGINIINGKKILVK